MLQKLMDETETTSYRLSQWIGCSQSSIRNWTVGGRKPYASTMERIANIFGVSVRQLNGEDQIDFSCLLKPPVNPSVGPATDDNVREETDDLIREIAYNPYARALFYTMKGATPEEYQQAAEIVKMIRRTGK